MKILKRRNKRNLFLMLFYLLLILIFPGALMGAEVPSAEDVAFGKASLPTIEELTGGNVKEGDLIDKNNIDLVKEFLTAGQAKCIKDGQVMRMANHKPKPLEGTPIGYNELTERHRGKAILDPDYIKVYFEKKGVLWPGGCPFPEPRTAKEVMANHSYGIVQDDFLMKGRMNFVNKDGKLYKQQGMWGYFIWVNTRTVIPPLGAWPGYEDQMYRKVTVFTTPLEAKGLGGFNIRYYDEVANYDQGYYYHPAFKKTGRSNATTWMNNAGGTDYTYDDGMGITGPLVDWSFKYLGVQYKFHTEYIAPGNALIDEKMQPIKDMEYDFGKKYPRLGYAVIPFHVVEAIPVIRHVYGKKMLYVLSYRYCKPVQFIPMVDIYDRQMKLWKYFELFNGHYDKEGHYAIHQGCCMWDLQSRHSTIYWLRQHVNAGLKPKDASLKSLLAKGR